MALIIVAEDEFLLGDMLATLLEDCGHEVIVAPHGAAALEIIRSKLPDLVITDFMMPLMTGLELAEQLRAEQSLDGMPVVLLSGAQGKIGRARPDMFNAVLDKPYDPKRLISLVDELLAKRQA